MSFGKKTVETKVAPVVEKKPAPPVAVGPTVPELLARCADLEAKLAAHEAAHSFSAEAESKRLRGVLEEILAKDCKSLPGEQHVHRCGGPWWHEVVRKALA